LFYSSKYLLCIKAACAVKFSDCQNHKICGNLLPFMWC